MQLHQHHDMFDSYRHCSEGQPVLFGRSWYVSVQLKKSVFLLLADSARTKPPVAPPKMLKVKIPNNLKHQSWPMHVFLLHPDVHLKC